MKNDEEIMRTVAGIAPAEELRFFYWTTARVMECIRLAREDERDECAHLCWSRGDTSHCEQHKEQDVDCEAYCAAGDIAEALAAAIRERGKP